MNAPPPSASPTVPPSAPPTPGALAVATALFALSVRERIPEEALLHRLRSGDRRLHSEMRLCLAWALRHLLRRTVPDLAAVLVVGSSLEESARPRSDLDLVLQTAEPAEGARRLLEELNADVSRAWLALLAEAPDGFRILDLHVVTDEDAARGDGFAPFLRGSGAASHRLPSS